MIGEQIVADSPISSGKAGHSTPSGHFSVMEKDPDHRSSIYGDFVDGSGRTVRAGISAKIDSAPSGTHYVGAPMRWFMRLTGEGVGMHFGILPGYPASHGCIRMSSDGAKLFYDTVTAAPRSKWAITNLSHSRRDCLGSLRSHHSLSNPRRKRSSVAWAANCLNVSRSVGKRNFLATVSESPEASAM